MKIEKWDITVDAIGLLCPLPVLKLRKCLAALGPGQRVCLLADDPAAAIDVPHFCHETGHSFLGQDTHPDATAYFVEKRENASARCISYNAENDDTKSSQDKASL